MGFKGRINLCGRCYYDIWYGRFFIFISSIKYDKKVLCLGRNKNILRAFRKNGYHISCLYPAKRLLPKLINVITTQIRLE